MIRLQKALAERGVASRRRAEELITGGRVRVEGETVMTLGTKVEPDARIEVDGLATERSATRYLLLNKPKGIVSTANDERGRKTVVELVGARERLYPVGRLDTDSEGMLLLTNDGDWAERVLHPRYGHEREYDVTVSGELTAEATTQLRNGIRLEEGLAVAVRVDVRSRSRTASRLRIVLHTGWRRQIRRMLAAVGLKTVRLVRVRIGNVVLGKLREGEWRDLTPAETRDLARPAERPRLPRVSASPSLTSAPLAASRPGMTAARAASRPGMTAPLAAPKPSLRATPRRAATGSPRARGPSAQRPSPPPSPRSDSRRPATPPSPRADSRRPSSQQDSRRAASSSGARRPMDRRAPTSRPSTGSNLGGRRPATGRPARDQRGPAREQRGARDERAPRTFARPTARATARPPGRARAPQRPTFPLRPGGRRPLPKYGSSRGPVRAKITPR
ncbi:MAG TPA: pseudouridine synthase [Candidatus Limnocylindrales bacterium]|nr:pseudouridine synthase [Candidatus Limnocylindrales bacterium]